MNPRIKHVKWMPPAICGIMNPVISIMVVYIIFLLVGADMRLIPIIEKIIPDDPTVGIEEGMMKDANTDIRYIDRRFLNEAFFLFKQNHKA